MIDKKPTSVGKQVWITFSLPASEAKDRVAVVGDFNAWNTEADLMKLNKKAGAWEKKIRLKLGERYEFRYLVDGTFWRNDESADGTAYSPFFSENSVIQL